MIAEDMAYEYPCVIRAKYPGSMAKSQCLRIGDLPDAFQGSLLFPRLSLRVLFLIKFEHFGYLPRHNLVDLDRSKSLSKCGVVNPSFHFVHLH